MRKAMRWKARARRSASAIGDTEIDHLRGRAEAFANTLKVPLHVHAHARAREIIREFDASRNEYA